MNRSLRILCVEDSENDALFLIRELQHGGYNPVYARVETAQAMHAALDQAAWDLVIADYNMPQFSAPAALALLQERGLDLPFIVVSGTIGEERAIAILKAGAHDFIVKDHLARLLPAVARELREAEGRAARKQAEDALRASETRKGAILATALDCIITIDHTGRITEFNPAAEQTFGYHRDEVLGQEMAELIIPPSLRARHRWRLAQYLATNEGTLIGRRIEINAVRADGTEFPIELSITRIPTEGPPLFTGFIRDITARKRAEVALLIAHVELEQRVAERTAELVQANARLQHEINERKQAETELEKERALLARRVEERTADLSAANADLARGARLKDEFLASMSHELRTPLNTILGMAEALQQDSHDGPNDKQRRALRHISESGNHLLTLINDILDLSRIGAGKLELQIGPVDVAALCQASLRMTSTAAHKKQLKISFNCPPTLGTIAADGRRLKQILVNLLSNAVKFTPDGGAIGLEVTGDEAQRVLHFDIWDTGIGIAHDDLARLFQPFVQLDSSLARQYTGTGLGLSLVARMVELHGGSVAVESTVGQGSRFLVSLPWRHPGSIIG